MKFADRVKESMYAVDTTTATITLMGAPAGYRTFASAFAVGDAGICVCVADTVGNWEIGSYTLATSTLLVRDIIISSSNNNAAVTFTTGAKEVFCTVTAKNFLSGFVDPDDVGFDIWLAIGQSNMCGRGVLDTLTDFADSRVYQFGGATGDSARYQTIFSGANPIHNVEGVNTGQNSPQVPFANTYAGMVPANRKILLVPCAQGGTTMVSGTPLWAPGNPGGALFENAISQANAAITAAKALYPNSRFVGTIMHLGESDTQGGTTQAQFVAAGKTLISLIRSRVTGASDSLFVIGGLAPGFIAAYNNRIDLAHKQLAQEVRNCSFAPGPSGFDDALHYNAKGVRLLGAKMGLAVPAAKLNPGIALNASTLTLSLSSSSVVIGNPVTVTVGTDNTLTGAQTESVTLTAPMAGTWSQNPVTLNASNPIAMSTFTPSAVNSGNITAAATGTPTISSASKAFASTAAATAPGAPTIGAATPGDGYVDFAFTAPASDGGAGITSYQLKVYNAGDNSLIGTFTGTSSPIRGTGLTNGILVYGKVAATNNVNTGAQSAASNSVSPAAVTTPAIRARAGFTMLTEGGSDPNWTYTGAGETGFNATGAVMNLGLAANALGSMSFVRQTAPNGGADQFELAVIVGTSPLALAGRVVTLLNSSGGNYAVYVAGSAVTATNIVAAAVGDVARIRRSAVTTTATYILEVSKDGGNNWTTIYTLTGATAAAVNFQIQIVKSGATQGRMGGFVGVGLTSPDSATATAWNASDKDASLTLSNGNLTVTGTTASTDNWHSVRANTSKSSGKWYYEVTVTAAQSGGIMIGAGGSDVSLSSFVGSTPTSWGYFNATGAYQGGTVAGGGTPATYGAADVIGVAFDVDAGTVDFYKNNVLQGTAHTGLGKPTFPMISTRDKGAPATVVTANFGATAFTYTPPSGYSRIDALSAATSYTTMNPADKNSAITLSGGNLQLDYEVTHNASDWETARSVAGKTSGKWYFEAKMLTAAATLVGVADSTLVLTDFAGSTANSVGYYNTGTIYRAGASNGGTPATYTTNDIIGVALDMDNKTVQFFKNGVAQGTVTGLNATAMYAAVTGKDGSPGTSVLMNFGATAFMYTPPSGFVGLS